jgi:hypothetical protein
MLLPGFAGWTDGLHNQRASFQITSDRGLVFHVLQELLFVALESVTVVPNDEHNFVPVADRMERLGPPGVSLVERFPGTAFCATHSSGQGDVPGGGLRKRGGSRSE